MVLRCDCSEPVIAAEAPTAVEPLGAAADIARKECLGLVDPEAGLVEHRQAASAARYVRQDRGAIGGEQDEVTAVVQQVRCLQIERLSAELQILRDADRASHLSFDAHVAIEMEVDARTNVVVAEAWAVRIRRFSEERRSRRNDRDDDRSRPGHRVLCVRRPCSDQRHRAK